MAENLQTKRTRKMIQLSMVTLLQEKDFRHITINDIAKRSLINRQTFYNYYQDKYDLIEQMTNENIDFLKKLLTARIQSIQDDVPLKQFLHAFSTDMMTLLDQRRQTILALWDISYNQYSFQHQLVAFFIQIINQSPLPIHSDYVTYTISNVFLANFKEILTRNALPTTEEIKEFGSIIKIILH